VNPPQPLSSPFELRWRLFGIGFRIAGSFWIMNALMGWLVIDAIQRAREQIIGTSEWLILILLWVVCTLVSVLVHELGHVIMGRIFGQPGDIALGGLAGKASGKYEYLRPWERIFVAAAGPGAGFLFLALLVAVDSNFWNLVMDWLGWAPLKINWFLIDRVDPLLRMGSSIYYTRVMFFLLLINLFMNLLNLLPIYPMDGGMILREVSIMISPANGLMFTFGFSFFLAGLVFAYSVVKLTTNRDPAGMALDVIFLLTFGMIAFQNFMGLWQETKETRERRARARMAQRAAPFKEHFDD
jgi:stage IV sporulation protein FB